MTYGTVTYVNCNASDNLEVYLKFLAYPPTRGGERNPKPCQSVLYILTLSRSKVKDGGGWTFEKRILIFSEEYSFSLSNAFVSQLLNPELVPDSHILVMIYIRTSQ